MSDALSFKYGRMLSDFKVGETYLHPWEVTLDAGMAAFYAASFLDATPVFSSAAYAKDMGLAGRPLPPLLCLNLALSFSVHDVSEQAIAHLAYVDVRFPDAAYVGDTVRARSTVIEAKPSSSGDKGVVHVRTILETTEGNVVCAFERKALIRGGAVEGRPVVTTAEKITAAPSLSDAPRLPPELRSRIRVPERPATLWGHFEDFRKRQVFAHATGKTIGETEHMQLTALCRNSHPLHFDELYCKDGSFTKQRVVYGGLVFGWVAALASRDLAGNALWDLGYEAGAHPSSVAAGDTLYAASKVLQVEDGEGAGTVTFSLVGVKNVTSQIALGKYGDSLFDPELAKKENRIPEKVFEIKRTLLVAKRR